MQGSELIAGSDCPAMYVAEDLTGWSVRANGSTQSAAKLRERALDETASLIPVETVLRAVGLFLADRGRPDVMAEVEAFLAEGDR